MTDEHWVTAALTNDAVVAELLMRMKQPSSLDSSQSLSPTTMTATAWWLPPIKWGHRKSRSKPSAITNVAVGGGFRKEQQSGSPTTPLCWSASDSYDESRRPSDLPSGGRSTKGGLGNEGASTSSCKKSRKRKTFAELREEEDFLLKERLLLKREVESIRLRLNHQTATSQTLKKFKIDMCQNPKEENDKMGFVLPDLNMIPDDLNMIPNDEDIARA